MKMALPGFTGVFSLALTANALSLIDEAGGLSVPFKKAIKCALRTFPTLARTLKPSLKRHAYSTCLLVSSLISVTGRIHQ